MAAKKSELGAVHAALTKVFIRVLERYMKNLDELEALRGNAELAEDINDEIADEAMQLIMPEDLMPNPAMLSAVSKFLKDNEIRFDDEDVDKLSTLERSLAEKRKVRGNVVSLTNLKAVGDE